MAKNIFVCPTRVYISGQLSPDSHGLPGTYVLTRLTKLYLPKWNLFGRGPSWPLVISFRFSAKREYCGRVGIFRASIESADEILRRDRIREISRKVSNEVKITSSIVAPADLAAVPRFLRIPKQFPPKGKKFKVSSAWLWDRGLFENSCK